MHAPHDHLDSLASAAEIPSDATAAAQVPLTGIERLMADALIALDQEPAVAMATPGAIEYASWIRMLHRATP